MCSKKGGHSLFSLRKVSLVPLHETFLSHPARVNHNVFGVENCKIQPRDWPWVSCIEGRFFHHQATREAHYKEYHVALSSARMQCYPQSQRKHRLTGVPGLVQFLTWCKWPGEGLLLGWPAPQSPHVLSAPLGLFCSTWSRQRCSDVLTDTPHYHFFKYSHFCKQHNFRAQLLGGLSLRLPFLAAWHCLPWTIRGWWTGN